MFRSSALSLVVAAGVVAVGLSAAPALANTTHVTSLTIKSAKSTVAPHQKTTVTGTLKSGDKPLSGQPVVLEKRAAGAKAFTVVSTQVTSPKGSVSYPVTPGSRRGQNEQYELVFKGTSTYRPSHSQVITISVS